MIKIIIPFIFIITFPEVVSFLTTLRLTGWLQRHAPPQQLGQDFRPSHSEDGGHRWNGGFTVAWIRQQIAQERPAAAPNLLPGTASEGKGGNQRRTEEDAPPPELAVLCLSDTCTPAKTSTAQTQGSSWEN